MDDRTGWAAAAMLMLLGVSDELVMEAYLPAPVSRPWRCAAAALRPRPNPM
jgi:protein tyrosine/serine phosphatase